MATTEKSFLIASSICVASIVKIKEMWLISSLKWFLILITFKGFPRFFSIRWLDAYLCYLASFSLIITLSSKLKLSISKLGRSSTFFSRVTWDHFSYRFIKHNVCSSSTTRVLLLETLKTLPTLEYPKKISSSNLKLNYPKLFFPLLRTK